jgi:CubicO group peptidase (beta-lactamase class C family)
MQKAVQSTIDRLVESGAERGIQVAAYRNGEQVVDAVAGIADPATGRRVTSATPFYNFSICKAATATLVHQLAERGALTYDTPVAGIWPEFGAQGKAEVTIRQVLNHSAGVPQIPLDTTIEDLCDWDHVCAAIAAQELWWEPGTKIGYHAYTFGYILGEVVRRTAGKALAEVLEESIATPLGVTGELYFGMPAAEQHRLAVLEDAPMAGPMPEMPPDLPMFRAAPMTLMPTATLGNRPDVLAADIPAGGKTTARAIARLYAAVLGPVDGVELMSEERSREATAVSMGGPDQVFGMETRWGLGYAIGAIGIPDQEPPVTFGVGGSGGSFAGADRSRGLAFAVTKNRLGFDFGTAAEVIGLIHRLS